MSKDFAALVIHPALQKYKNCYLKLTLNGSNIFGAMEIGSRYEQFKPLRVNHSTKLGDKSRVEGKTSVSQMVVFPQT